MYLIRDLEQYKLELVDDKNIKLLQMKFIADEFVIYVCNLVTITKDIDEVFYDNLEILMNNNYSFSNPYSKKTEDKIIWFSDEACDIEDKNEADKINRLIIRKENDCFHISCNNPFFERNRITKEYGVIVFSPAGNGQYSKNLETGTTFQDDMITLYRNTLNKNKVLQK